MVHLLREKSLRRGWIAGSSPAMTSDSTRCDGPIRPTVSHSRFRSRGAFCARVLLFGFAQPHEGVAERRESYGSSETHGPARDAAGQAPSEAPCVSRRRPPLGARTVAILGAGAALPLTGIAAGSVTANSSHPGRSARRRGPCLPGRRLRAAAAGRHASLRLQVASGRRPLNEQGWQCSRVGAQSTQ
jgi:hypothetical protein